MQVRHNLASREKNEGMDDLDTRIADLEANIKSYEDEYETASSTEKSELRGLIKAKVETLNRLLDQQAAQTSRSPANVFGIYSPPNVVRSP